MRRLWQWFQGDSVQRSCAVLCVALGAHGARMLWVDAHSRLDALEERGLVPIDDLATVGDLGKLEGRLLALETQGGGEPEA